MSARLALKLGPPRQFPKWFRGQAKTHFFHQQTCNVTRRWYQARSGKATDLPFAYTWLTRTPDQIVSVPCCAQGDDTKLNQQETPDDVLTSFPSTSSSLAESGDVPILLVTPSFAHWFNSDNTFLEQWINRLYQNPTTPAPIHAVLAIVDRIPDPRPQSDIGGRKADTPDTLTESEGLALTFAKAENIAGKASALRSVRSTTTEESSLIFSIETTVPDTPGQSVRRPVHEVGLRLANTIFINGNDTTLLGTRWVYDSSSSKYNLDQTLSLSSCVVRNFAQSLQSSFGLPLYPVSQRRKVIASMGNILRQLAKHADDPSNEPMPASSELEKELPRYIAEHNIADRRVSVWALVEKPGNNASSEATLTQDRLTSSVQAGGKLHRVMSGGGGWGKKQGLLSLDPETSFLDPSDRGQLSSVDRLFSLGDVTPAGESFASLDKYMMMDDLSSLSQVAEQGDYVQFFVSVEPKSEHTKLSELPDGGVTYRFGVLSDAESLTSISPAHKELIAVPHYFGALTEKAIAYSQPKIDPDSKGGVLETSTKCDIPGCRVEMTLS
ncbi:uncharacterized protein ACLA_040230 [Aspergillus clavatus NRRL 1]|uniref:V-type ATPase, C subunit family protein n=1 Tax=Aspergillus clavatus (strain ATCC 1007 / CBS 513.65 / DSM 816 / NCTC 3887 / NRRL 1 / QM 1276 / 107) TaxID=344612 RepID=A1CKY3_ASPCL|nr:uncharacterized protein ACLA_040230 [Aspergillus clavatus NRRL 1]EAW09807.1 conserved hypothetical protein [Aspergillus clavatus NRRL 1]